MSFKLRQASGTYTQTLRLALLATRIIVALVSLCLGVMLLTSAIGHHPVLSRALAALHKPNNMATSPMPRGDGFTTACKIFIAAWAFITCASTLYSATVSLSSSRQERPCNTTECGGPYACSFSTNYLLGCGWVLVTLGVGCSHSLQGPASAFSLAHFVLSAAVLTLLSLSAVLVDLLKYAGMSGVATQPPSMAV